MDSLNKEKKELLEKFDSLNTELKTLRADAMKSSTLQDIVDILNNDKKQMTESLEALKSKHEKLNQEKTELTNRNEKLINQEQELTNQLQAFKEDVEKLIKEKDHLVGENHELSSVNKKQEEVETLLRADLEEMGKVSFSISDISDWLNKLSVCLYWHLISSNPNSILNKRNIVLIGFGTFLILHLIFNFICTLKRTKDILFAWQHF